MKKHILAVIPVHNRLGDLKNLISSLSPISDKYENLSVAVVDDGSSVPVRPEIESRFPHIKFHFFHNETPKGPGFSRNLAVRNVKSNYIWFLDSDSEILNKDVLKNMLDKVGSIDKLGAVGGTLEAFGGYHKVMELEILKNFIFLCRAFTSDQYNPSYVDGISSSNLFIRRELFEEVGGFKEYLKRDEDNDLCLSLRKKGYGVYQSPDTTVLHKLSSSGRDTGQFAHFKDQSLYIKDLLQTRTLLLAEHAHWRLPVLPLIDMILAPVLFYRIKKGTYVISRFNKMVRSSRLQYFFILILNYTRSYLYGLVLFIKKVL